MKEIGAVVLYGTDGVCRVNDICEKKFGKTTSRYYVLSALFRSGSYIYVPVGNDNLEAKMRTVLTPEESENVIGCISDIEPIWIVNEVERKIRFKEIIAGTSRTDFVGIIKALRKHRIEQINEGKRMHISDEKFLKDAEKLLFDEMAYVKGSTPSEISELLDGALSVF